MSERSSSDARVEPGSAVDERASRRTLAPGVCGALCGPLCGRAYDCLEPVLDGLAQLLPGRLAARHEARQPIPDRGEPRLQLAHRALPCRPPRASGRRPHRGAASRSAARPRSPAAPTRTPARPGARRSAAAASCSAAARSTRARTTGEAAQRAGERPADQVAHVPARPRRGHRASGAPARARSAEADRLRAESLRRRATRRRPAPRASSRRGARVTSRSASSGTRLSTIDSAVPRSLAVARNSQGTASAYRAAVVTNSQASAAARSCVARARFSASTESMSGASRSARPGSKRGGRRQQERAGGRRAAGHPGQARQDPVVLEPAHVVRVADENWTTRRRPEHPGRADLRADEAVHDGRLPCARRPADHHQDGSVHPIEAREQVVVDLTDEVVPRGARRSCVRQLKLEPEPAKLVPESPQSCGQLGSHRRGRRRATDPNDGSAPPSTGRASGETPRRRPARFRLGRLGKRLAATMVASAPGDTR